MYKGTVLGFLISVASRAAFQFLQTKLMSHARWERLRQRTNAPMAKPVKAKSAAMPTPAPAPADKPPFEAAPVPE